jgi:hypothetical protein
MGHEDFASPKKSRAIIPGEADAFFSANLKRLAGGAEQAASEELGTDCCGASKA